jgi:hypothetical protein
MVMTANSVLCCEARAGIYYLCSKIRSIVLYDLAHITCPHKTMEELLSRLNTAQAFRVDSWQQGNGFATLWRASLPGRWKWAADNWEWNQQRLQWRRWWRLLGLPRYPERAGEQRAGKGRKRSRLWLSRETVKQRRKALAQQIMQIRGMQRALTAAEQARQLQPVLPLRRD